MSRPGDDEGGFLGRWARRKQEAQREAREPAPAPVTETPPDPKVPAADLPLPSLDSIVPGADVSAFFQAHVPEGLRKAALRKLWTTDPEISSFIEMADYQWDFNNPDAIPGWGSKLDTTDVRRLAERLMGGGDKKRSTEEDRETIAGVEADQGIPGGAASDGVAAAEVQTELPSPPLVLDEGPLAADGAVQKTPSDSVLYASIKKRHGGALPS